MGASEVPRQDVASTEMQSETRPAENLAACPSRRIDCGRLRQLDCFFAVDLATKVRFQIACPVSCYIA
jgi:hypothetical protein